MKLTDIGALCLLLVAFGFSDAHAEVVADALKACARMSDYNHRIACYEALGARVLNDEVAAVPQTTPNVIDVPPQNPVATTQATEQLPGKILRASYNH